MLVDITGSSDIKSMARNPEMRTRFGVYVVVKQQICAAIVCLAMTSDLLIPAFVIVSVLCMLAVFFTYIIIAVCVAALIVRNLCQQIICPDRRTVDNKLNTRVPHSRAALNANIMSTMSLIYLKIIEAVVTKAAVSTASDVSSTVNERANCEENK